MISADLKSALYKSCLQYAHKRIGTAQAALDSAQEASNEESKSTAGDKHDTSRSMMQIEVEQASRQLSEAEKLRDELSRIIISKNSEVIMAGSLVKTAAGNYFIAISAGKIELEKDIYFAVSISSPIAQAMKGLKKGDQFQLNGKSILIQEVI
jgi:transcription elongation GreA/GreB family factor